MARDAAVAGAIMAACQSPLKRLTQHVVKGVCYGGAVAALVFGVTRNRSSESSQTTGRHARPASTAGRPCGRCE